MKPKELWSMAKKNKQAIPSFNFSSLDVALTISRIVQNSSYQCLVSTSERELNFQTIEIVVAGIKALQKQGYPVFLNLDHGKIMDTIQKAIQMGFDCIHFDGSSLSFEDNIHITKQIVEQCKPLNISIEGEIGKIGGSSTLQDESTPESILTDPNEAIRFVKETSVDILACSFGSGHGLSKEPEILKTEILDEISKQIEIPFVLHGGSGIVPSEIKKAIDAGVVKINFNTELRIAWHDGMRDYCQLNTQDIVPVNILTAADERVAKVVEDKIMLCLNR
jgi:fructose-bisphosphate aldolase class II